MAALAAAPQFDERSLPPTASALNLPLGTPLCVDLDGTLVKSDTLLDATLLLVRQRPADALRLPGWIGQGKAALKREVTARAELDVEHLPYNRPLLAWLRREQSLGRPLYLATAADGALAGRVAAYLGIFAGVFASDGATNLAGDNKLAAFRARFGDDFCYIGNASADVPLLTACRAPMVANPTRGLSAKLRSAGVSPVATFTDSGSLSKTWLKAIRLHQWAKNALLFVPMLLAHEWGLAHWTETALAFVSFGMCASATYIINDLLDIEADRMHPRKRRRPFASGDISPLAGIAVTAMLLLGAVTLAMLLPVLVDAMPSAPPLLSRYGYLGWLGLYTATTLAYSFYLKRRLLLDVFVLSGLYTIRILAGGSATGIPMSPWLAGFSVFFFLSLAFVKRFSELDGLRERGGTNTSGRGYTVADLEQVRALGTGAMFASVVVMTLYISDPKTLTLYAHVIRLWLVVPILLLWLSRIWMLASRGEMHDDPVVFAITDRRSLALGAAMALVILWAV